MTLHDLLTNITDKVTDMRLARTVEELKAPASLATIDAVEGDFFRIFEQAESDAESGTYDEADAGDERLDREREEAER